jgi:hypothetical protein
MSYACRGGASITLQLQLLLARVASPASLHEHCHPVLLRHRFQFVYTAAWYDLHDGFSQLLGEFFVENKALFNSQRTIHIILVVVMVSIVLIRQCAGQPRGNSSLSGCLLLDFRLHHFPWGLDKQTNGHHGLRLPRCVHRCWVEVRSCC